MILLGAVARPWHTFKTNRSSPHMTLTGKDICTLMRKHGVTIRDLKAKFGVTLKRTRYVRTNGVAGGFALDWVWMITGAWPECAAPTQA